MTWIFEPPHLTGCLLRTAPVLVLGCGRSGTNMMVEILRGSPELLATTNQPDGDGVEDRAFFQTWNTLSLPAGYLTKNVTAYIQDFDQIAQVWTKNPHLKIVWTIRDPRSLALSKLYRGSPIGDSPAEGSPQLDPTNDANYLGCIRDIVHMQKLYEQSIRHFPNNNCLVSMEEIILDIDRTIARVCDFCEIEISPDMRHFIPRYRNHHKANRYLTLDKSQINIHLRASEIYDGYFAGQDWRHPSWGDITIEDLWDALRGCVAYFNYDVDNQ